MRYKVDEVSGSKSSGVLSRRSDVADHVGKLSLARVTNAHT